MKNLEMAVLQKLKEQMEKERISFEEILQQRVDGKRKKAAKKLPDYWPETTRNILNKNK